MRGSKQTLPIQEQMNLNTIASVLTPVSVSGHTARSIFLLAFYPLRSGARSPGSLL
jgi:hypothetical protein